MADDCLPESLRLIASVLRSGQFGQRDLWVDQIEAAATEIERLKKYLRLRGEDIVTLGLQIGKLTMALDEARQFINDWGPDEPGEMASLTNGMLARLDHELNRDPDPSPAV